MLKKYYEYVFVILTYRNTEDIKECLISIEKKFNDYKAVIVNSYYDESSKMEMEKIAEKYNCDFLNVENRGYGYGNNCGVQFCKKEYDFSYLVISNPDIIVKKNDFLAESYLEKAVVIAPVIKTLTGKWQNPYWVKKNCLAEFFIYSGYKHMNKFVIYSGIAINKIIRELSNRLFFRNKDRVRSKVYASHGSFVIFSKKAVQQLGDKIYDENMFLFAEEAYLAHVLEEKNIPVIFTKEIDILHKEDGSMNVSNINEKSELRKSVVYYYEKLDRRSRWKKYC